MNPLFVHRVLKPEPCWILKFRFKRKIIQRKTFLDKKYGGKERGFKLAIELRDKIAKGIGFDVSNHLSICHIKEYRYTHNRKSKRNKTGVIGVQYVKMGKYFYYKASISKTKGVETVKSFNCSILGKEESFKKAVQQRKDWEKELINNKRERKIKDEFK